LLKRETRILGLSGTTRNRRTIIATVVFRGSLWLDGVSTAIIEDEERNLNLKVSNLIKNSKQFSQLHAIIISQRLTPNRPISIHELAQRLKLPVIAISKPHKITRRGNASVKKFSIAVGGKTVAATAAGAGIAQAQRLYKVGCSPHSKVPEAVRIADLLIEELSRKFK